MDAATTPDWMWLLFAAIVLTFMALDLGILNRKEHKVSAREAMIWVSVWMSLAIAFNVGVYFWYGQPKALQFLTGYIIEQALSIDNIFVFIVIFDYFVVPREYQHRVLFWGVLGAFVLRALFIFVGTALITRFHWLIFLFGAFLVFTGVKILVTRDGEKIDPAKSPIVRAFRRLFPVTASYHGSRFLAHEAGRVMATPLLVVLAMVESTDVVFALDSIPAIFAVTTDPFIVYTSNIFAILGLRNLYFVLADFMDRFQYLKVGLGFVLVFVGIKMAVSDFWHIPITLSLGVIATLLLGSILLSLGATRRTRRRGETAHRAAVRDAGRGGGDRGRA